MDRRREEVLTEKDKYLEALIQTEILKVTEEVYELKKEHNEHTAETDLKFKQVASRIAESQTTSGLALSTMMAPLSIIPEDLRDRIAVQNDFKMFTLESLAAITETITAQFRQLEARMAQADDETRAGVSKNQARLEQWQESVEQKLTKDEEEIMRLRLIDVVTVEMAQTIKSQTIDEALLKV